jgi:DNA-binding GntR family transcriptional regulator
MLTSNHAGQEVYVRRLDDLVRLDRSSPVPLYFQVAQRLEDAIESGEIRAGTRLENELELAKQLGLSRPTIRRALEYLVDKGMLVRKRGAGTRVVDSKVKRAVELTSLYDDLLRSGQRPTTSVLHNGQRPAPEEVARELKVPDGTPVVLLERLRYAHEQPIAYMVNYLPVGIDGLTSEALETDGLYQLLRARGLRLHAAVQSIGARNATTAEARLLEESRGAALLTMRRVTYDDRANPLEYGTHIYRASRYSFEQGLLAR